MQDHPISSNVGVGRNRRKGRPRKYASDAARKLAWYHRQRQTGATTLQDVPPVMHEALYCHHCCLRQAVRRDGEVYICTLCCNPLQPPTPGHEEDCPRASDGQHNPYYTGAGWICSRCNAPLRGDDRV